MKKYFINIIILVLTAFSFTSCLNGDSGADTRPDAVVAILKNSNVDYWKQISKAISSECEKQLIMPLIAFNSENDDIKGQIEAVKELSDMEKMYNIKGIILAPVFTESDHSVEKAVADYAGSKIPVVIIDTPIDSSSPLSGIYKTYVGTNNREAGRQLALSSGITDASTVFIGKVGSSQPATERYAGFCEAMGKSIPYWNTDDEDKAENLMTQLEGYPQAKNLVFFNGSLCNSLTSAFEGYSVYTFDVYSSFLKSIKDGGAVKGIMAQNTFEMGSQAFKAIFAPVTTQNTYIPTLYITSENINSEAVKPFLEYYSIK